MASQSPILAPATGSVMHVMLTTMPFLVVLIYFLYLAYVRPDHPVYNLGDDYTDDEYKEATKGNFILLIDILSVFLGFHALATLCAVYLMVFIPKRRHFIGRYLKEGESTIGDVIYDKTSRRFGGFHDYGYAVYSHPHQRKMIRKRVRVYQQYTRERITILRLPNRPLSGQAKVDLEIDLVAASQERDTKNKYIALFLIAWVVFSLLGAAYVLYQMNNIQDERDDASVGKKVFLVVVGLNIPFAFAVNWIRFLMYRNWMVNRGAVVDDDVDARKVHGCLMEAESVDGSEVIPYSLLNEEELSYQGSLNQNAASQQHASKAANEVQAVEETEDKDKKSWVTM